MLILQSIIRDKFIVCVESQLLEISVKPMFIRWELKKCATMTRCISNGFSHLCMPLGDVSFSGARYLRYLSNKEGFGLKGCYVCFIPVYVA